jgi:hypothetical protein
MGNPLSTSVGATPPAPQPQQSAQPQTQGNALAGPSPAGGAPGQAQAPIQAPTHAETVTALRHFGAIENELTGLMKDPDLGKTDMRSKVIDGMTTLVADGILPASDAVKQMGTFPDKPYDQRQWLNQHFMQAVQAQTTVLQHHQIGAATGQDLQPGVEPDPDDHQSIISGMTSRYKGSA